jgi:hypothetical protein
VRVLTSNALATAVTLHPSSSTRRTITGRPNGVVRAFLWLVIRVLPRQLVMGRTNHLPAFSPDEQCPQKPHLDARSGVSRVEQLRQTSAGMRGVVDHQPAADQTVAAFSAGEKE